MVADPPNGRSGREQRTGAGAGRRSLSHGVELLGWRWLAHKLYHRTAINAIVGREQNTPTRPPRFRAIVRGPKRCKKKEMLRPLSPPEGGGQRLPRAPDPIFNPQQLWQRERPLRASSTRTRGLMRHLNPVGQRGARRTRVWFAVRHLSFRDCLVLLFNVVAPTHPHGILKTSTNRPGGLDRTWVCPRDCPRK